jgi:hypothetical protein
MSGDFSFDKHCDRVTRGYAKIFGLLACGNITPTEARSLSRPLDAQLRTLRSELAKLRIEKREAVQ